MPLGYNCTTSVVNPTTVNLAVTRGVQVQYTTYYSSPSLCQWIIFSVVPDLWCLLVSIARRWHWLIASSTCLAMPTFSCQFRHWRIPDSSSAFALTSKKLSRLFQVLRNRMIRVSAHSRASRGNTARAFIAISSAANSPSSSTRGLLASSLSQSSASSRACNNGSL